MYLFTLPFSFQRHSTNINQGINGLNNNPKFYKMYIYGANLGNHFIKRET